jgi:hypothetical protein
MLTQLCVAPQVANGVCGTQGSGLASTEAGCYDLTCCTCPVQKTVQVSQSFIAAMGTPLLLDLLLFKENDLSCHVT